AAYYRIENWYEDIKQFTFPTKFISITREQGVMITQFYEELRLRAGVNDLQKQERGEEVPAGADSIYDVAFREEFYQFVRKDWREDWRVHLEALRSDLETAIAECEHGAFVKLSNRSPKESA